MTIATLSSGCGIKLTFFAVLLSSIRKELISLSIDKFIQVFLRSRQRKRRLRKSKDRVASTPKASSAMKCCQFYTLLLSLTSLSTSIPVSENHLSDSENLDDLPQWRDKRQTSEICDFGSDNDQNTCDWTNRNGSLLTWEFGAGSLSNWLGGPSKDANGDPKGGYIFFESSLLATDPRIAQNAFIESAVLPTTSLEGKCISFNYAIEGLSIAGLRVLLHPVLEEEKQDSFDRILWSSKDSTQKEWKKAAVLYTYNKEHQIIFEGVARDLGDPLRRYRGFVAVDNIARNPGSDCSGHCTFEGGFCSWFNEEGDDFEWSLGRGSTNPSTGPATDRSSSLHGGLEGGYAYIDSSYPRKPGDIALLSSEDFEATAVDEPLCLRFWTHMYGSGIGTLSVIINDKDEGTDTELWSLSGEAGNTWRQAEVPISCPSNFRIIIAGQVGKNQMGDIAIDDISLMPGSCPIYPQEAAILPGDCRFEEDECGWVNASPRERTDDFDWDRIAGQATRPIIFDHSLGTDKGYFLALARGNTQKAGSRALLGGKEIRNQKGPRCMSFWYIMNEPYIESAGPSLGSLTVYTKTFDKNNIPFVTPKWQLYNHQGPEWKFAQTYIDDNNYTVIIEGAWGSSKTNGFIAIDDITFYNGNCSILPKEAEVRIGDCHFDRDTCGWVIESQKVLSYPTWRLAVNARRPANLPDKTFGAPEGYVYFDLFNHNAALNSVNFISPKIPANGEMYCMAFWFAAFGADEDALLKIVRQDNTTNYDSPRDELWELQAKYLETLRPVWTPAQITLDGSTDFLVIMQGMATNGGFAVDDITFSKGSCPTRPENAKIQHYES